MSQPLSPESMLMSTTPLPMQYSKMKHGEIYYNQLPTNTWDVCIFLAPRRGPGTHCLRMRQGPQKNVGHLISMYMLYRIFPCDALLWRSASSVYQALFVVPLMAATPIRCTSQCGEKDGNTLILSANSEVVH